MSGNMPGYLCKFETLIRSGGRAAKFLVAIIGKAQLFRK
jgi:hypothetical protein